MTKHFERGARVRLTEDFFDAPAGTEFTVVEMVRPGFFAEGTVKVRHEEEIVPIVGGHARCGLIHSQFLEEVP